jgi:hypothetical protein
MSAETGEISGGSVLREMPTTRRVTLWMAVGDHVRAWREVVGSEGTSAADTGLEGTSLGWT